MTSVKPFGDIKTATILVIGHDPRLRRSDAEAETAFFFDLLTLNSSRPSHGPIAVKYVTNLCNTFLDSTHGRGTVLIPDDQAARGFEDICQAIDRGHFRLILPMSVQVFYHLCRLDFIEENDNRVRQFVQRARPSPAKAEAGIYVSAGKAPFVEVCGQRFHHRGIPVIPIVHIKQWPLKDRAVRYKEPMEHAKKEIRKTLA